MHNAFQIFACWIFFRWTSRVGILTTPEDLYMTAAIPMKDRLERQGNHVILRTLEPVIYGSQQVSDFLIWLPIRWYVALRITI